MAYFIYIDYSNLYLSKAATNVHVYNHGSEMSERIQAGSHYSVNFRELYRVLTMSAGTISRCLLMGSISFGEELLPFMAEKAGFEAIFYRRTVYRGEKKVDVGIAAQIVKDAYTKGKPGLDTCILVSGDSDFVPVVEMLTGDGYSVEIWFWNSASSDLKKTATRFNPLDHVLDLINTEKIPASPINAINVGINI